jgi:hypothetical protein
VKILKNAISMVRKFAAIISQLILIVLQMIPEFLTQVLGVGMVVHIFLIMFARTPSHATQQLFLIPVKHAPMA